MKVISAILVTLSDDDKKEFVAFLRKKNQRGDTKNVRLFKLINNGQHNELDIQLYGKPSKNAFHALCKRLQDSLIDFVASRSLSSDTSEEMEILKLLMASRIFFEHKQYQVGFKTLAKAEKKALQLDLYSILSEIYHTKIQYAHINPSEALSEVIKMTQENTKNFQNELKLNMAYASIKTQLKLNPNKPINDLLVECFSNFEIELDDSLTYKSLSQLMNITVTAAKLQSDYYTVSPFMEEIHTLITQKKDVANKHLFYHIEILYLMAITFFRNKEFDKSKKFIDVMETEMQKRNGMYLNRYSEKFLVIKALHLNYTGQFKEAIELLSVYKGESLDIKLTLIMCLFQQKRFSEAYHLLKGFYHSDSWFEKKMGWIWVLKKSIIEILLLIELDKLDLVLSRIKSFKRKFAKGLTNIGEDRVISFINLIEYYYERPREVKTPEFAKKVEHSFKWIGADKEDIFVMSFYAWLKSKMTGKELYETTLELVA